MKRMKRIARKGPRFHWNDANRYTDGVLPRIDDDPNQLSLFPAPDNPGNIEGLRRAYRNRITRNDGAESESANQAESNDGHRIESAS